MSVKKPKKKQRRPTKYQPEFCRAAYGFALLGCSDVKIGEYLGVSDTTIQRWAAAHPEFRGALSKGREGAAAAVAKSLLHKACGYKHRSVKIFCNAAGEVTEVPFTEKFAPDTAAAIYWLKNRASDIWKDKTEQTIETTGEQTISVRHIDLQERLKLLDGLK